MTKKPTSAPLPSRDEILAFIAREREAQGERTPAKIGKREIARAFQIKGADKIGLKRVLKDMETDGTVERRRKGLTKPGALPPTVVAEIYTRDRDGDLLAKPIDWDETNGRAPTIVLNVPRKQRPGTPTPGLGDRALVRTEPIRDAHGHNVHHNAPAYTGRVVKLLARARTQVLGIFRAGSKPGAGGQVFPVDKKAANKGALFVRDGDQGEAQDGDLVAVDVLKSARLGLPAARVSERVGSYSSEKAVSLIALHTHKIPSVFKPETLAEAEAAQPVGLKMQRSDRTSTREGGDLPLSPLWGEVGSGGRRRSPNAGAIEKTPTPTPSPQGGGESKRPNDKAMDRRAQAGREDWRELPLVTIDPPDAKDHDDAVHAAPDPDPTNPGGFVLTIAIADVAAYVTPRSTLDREALERGNSVYFPDRVVPMLPERISNDLCSLCEGEDRPALAMRIVIDAQGKALRHAIHRIMMRSRAKLAYAQAQAAIDGAADDKTAPLLGPVLRPLWAAYAALKIAREKRKPLDLDLPERKILLKDDGTVDRVVVPPRLDAHRLIEEFMILANVAAAELLEERRQALIYRAHGEPSVEKLHALAEFLQTIGLKLAKGQVVTPGQFNGILAKVRGTEHEQVVNDVVLRTQAQAEYTADNYGHFGLHLRRYAHFTSPIRRYADLVVHRALIRACGLGEGALPDTEKDELEDIAERISAAERRAMAAERETVDRLIATHLADRVGAIFEGRIAGVTRAGLFVKLTETGADGFIPAATLGDEFFRYEEAMHALVGARSGTVLRLGDAIVARLVEAAPFAGALRFERVTETASAGRGSRGKPKRDVPSSGARGRRRA